MTIPGIGVKMHCVAIDYVEQMGHNSFHWGNHVTIVDCVSDNFGAQSSYNKQTTSQTTYNEKNIQEYYLLNVFTLSRSPLNVEFSSLIIIFLGNIKRLLVAARKI